MPRIPVRVDEMPTEVSPLDEGIPYHVICRDIKVSDKEDKNGCTYLTGGSFEILEPEEWRGRRVFANYIPLPGEITASMNLAERRKVEEQGVALARLIKAFKVPYSQDGFNTEDMIGCEGDVTVQNEEYQGRMIPRIKDFLL